MSDSHSWVIFGTGDSSHAVERGTNFTICGNSAVNGRRVRKVKKCKLCLKLIQKANDQLVKV